MCCYGRALRVSAGSAMDIALDPLLFSGATTTCDVLWMGVPVLTCPGDSSVSRSCPSILTVLDMGEFIVANESTYIEAAHSWASRGEELSALRRGLCALESEGRP